MDSHFRGNDGKRNVLTKYDLSYAIGVARPVSILVETFDTGEVSDDHLLELIKQNFELRPAGIIQSFNLKRLPAERGGRFYQDVATYGYFGRTDLELPWEQTGKADLLNEAAGLAPKTLVSMT